MLFESDIIMSIFKVQSPSDSTYFLLQLIFTLIHHLESLLVFKGLDLLLLLLHLLQLLPLEFRKIYIGVSLICKRALLTIILKLSYFQIIKKLILYLHSTLIFFVGFAAFFFLNSDEHITGYLYICLIFIFLLILILFLFFCALFLHFL